MHLRVSFMNNRRYPLLLAFALALLFSVANLFDNELVISFLDFGGSGVEKAKHCRPCEARRTPGSMVFISNNTRDLFDPVGGPLVFRRNDIDASCQSCPLPNIIMTFVDDGYMDSLSVWLHYYKSLDHSQYILCLFALSETSFQKMERLISSSRDKFAEDFGDIVVVQATNFTRHDALKGPDSLWAYRMRTLRDFLHSFPSLQVTFTDLDAVWLRNPQPLFAPLPSLTKTNSSLQFDIVASQGTFPDKCSLLRQSKKKHLLENIGVDGGTAVFGFIHFHNSPSTRQLVADLANQAPETPEFDDQVALNCELYTRYNLLQSTRLSDGSFHLRYHLLSTNTSQANSTFAPINLRLLSGSQVVRNCGKYNIRQNATVAHCLTEKDGNSKMEQFWKSGLLPSRVVMFDWQKMAGNKSKLQIGTWGDSLKGYFNSSKGAAFMLAERRFQMRSSSIHHKTARDLFELFSSYGMGRNMIQILNSVRVPKAGSSALSITARALAGCRPDGYPACRFPGSPPGSCPREGLMCSRVKGQTDHRPNYGGRWLPTITSLRDPTARLLSAFFYTEPHRPEPASDHRWETFVEYIRMPKYRNVMTKMLSGSYAYDDYDETMHTVEKAKGRLCRMSWFYLVGMETAAALLLYETSPFDQLVPNPVVFDLPAVPVRAKLTKPARRELVGLTPTLTTNQEAPSNYSVQIDPTGKRHNDGSAYVNFRTNVFVENNGATLINEQNKEDFHVYEFSRQLLCARLGQSGILEAVATAADDTLVSYHSLKEKIKTEVQSFCPNGETVQKVQQYCPVG